MVSVFVTCAVVAASPARLTAAEAFKKVSPSVLLITSAEDGAERVVQGSGVAVDTRTIVTNWHVVETGQVVTVKGVGGLSAAAVLIAEDREGDLALLRLLSGEMRAAELNSLPPEVGTAVFAVGAPRGLEASMSKGIVSGIRRGDRAEWIQTDAAISHGSSGGGLFDELGRLIGITTMSVKAEQGLNFAIPTAAVRTLAAKGLSEFAARKSCDLPAAVVSTLKERLSRNERVALDGFLKHQPCEEKPATTVSPEELRVRQLRDAEAKEEDFTTAFPLSREFQSCGCSLAEARRALSNSPPDSVKNTDTRGTCATCLTRAFEAWKTRSTKQCELLTKLTLLEVGVFLRSADGPGTPERCLPANAAEQRAPSRQIRQAGRLYLRVSMKETCSVEVLPGPLMLRSGEEVMVPLGVRELSVRGTCGGLAEVFFGHEETPRVTELFGRNTPMRLRFVTDGPPSTKE